MVSMHTCAEFAIDWLDDWIWMVVDAGISIFDGSVLWVVVWCVLFAVDDAAVVVTIVVDVWLLLTDDAFGLWIFTTLT